MKVAIIDNTCNNGYVIMRYLNDRGIDTDLLLFGSVSGHADPENDTFNNQYFDKIINTGWSNRGLLWLKKKEVDNLLDKYDFVIGSDYAPAVFYRIKRILDVFIPHGTDLIVYPFAKIESLTKRSIGEWILAHWQRQGINQFVKYFMFELTNDDNEKCVQYFRKGKFSRIFKTTPLVYYSQYTSDALTNFSDKDQKVKLLASLKQEGYTVLFHHCQQSWKGISDSLFSKGNDKLIQGLAQFVGRNPGVKIKLVMVERGIDIDASKELIKQLGIEEHVVWFPLMPRKEIMACLTQTDIGIGELGHSWFTYCVVAEFMVMGVPIIHNCDMEYYKTVHPSVYPMHHADSKESLCLALEEYFKNPEPFSKDALAAQSWWKKNMADDAIDLVIKLINAKKHLNKIEID